MIAGRYRLERELGRGGMGAVWLGIDSVLGRPVALKQLTPVHAGGATAARAEREARLAARLSHPHVVAVFDLVHEDEQPWLVIEYVDGPPLSALIASRGRLSPDEAAGILLQVTDGLRAAHTAGVVHRDVKPSNILISAAGQAKLSDFGVARGTEPDATMTQTGAVTGSPAYLAPEVAAGGTSTFASDAWSLGATLFHCLTGHPPYEVGDNVLGALYRVVHEAPPRTELAGWLAPLLEGTMTRDPARRWSIERVHDFLAAGPAAARDRTQLLPAVSSTPRPSGGPPPHRPWRWLLGAASVVVLLAVVGTALVVGSGERRTPSAGGSAPVNPSSAKPSTPGPSTESAPTAAGVRTFVGAYLDTAVADPAAGYAMLTPGFQQASGGLGGYRSFWGHVVRVDRVGPIEPELGDALGVSYRYTYTTDRHRTVTETVHLRLLHRDGQYLISGD